MDATKLARELFSEIEEKDGVGGHWDYRPKYDADSAVVILQSAMDEVRMEACAPLTEALKNARETIEYAKNYVENRGLSAEDDCNNSLAEIDAALAVAREE